MPRPSLPLEVRAAGLYLPDLDLYLDPSREVPRAFISHAHGDHGGGFGSGTVLASRETLALLSARHGALAGALEEPWEIATSAGTARLSLAPAGHVLGASQLVIDHPGGRFVYTGDYRTGPGRTHATGAPVPCDTLAIESTFALPIFRWPDREREMARLVEWCRDGDALVLAYALGKAQEIVRALNDAGLAPSAHGAVVKMCEAYESLGVALGPVQPYVEQKKRKGPRGVLVAPPRAAAQLSKGRRVAYVSGHALIDALVDRYRADAAFVLSDHADFDDLVTTVRASGAGFVYTTHGDAVPFARHLNHLGIHAEARELGALEEDA